MRNLALTSLMLSLSSLAFAASPSSASLADQLPAGALVTLETKQASGGIDRILKLVQSEMKLADPKTDPAQVSEARQALQALLGQEGILGVFMVGSGKALQPAYLMVSRPDPKHKELFKLSGKPGAMVGGYSIQRQGGMFVGQGGGLLYASSNKDLLNAYLNRLTGKAAPRLGQSSGYSTLRQATGQQEFSFFLDFSAMTKMLRGYLAQAKLPRLLAPVVDALDTLGSFRAGLSTSAAGLNLSSAQQPNSQGADKPLLKLLTHTTDFQVQSVIPADAESVSASACSRDSAAYLSRWLTRLDLFEPFGFLSDSQLADHLQRSSAYLGEECAQVALAGSSRQGLRSDDPFASWKTMVQYQRITDRAAAEAHLPEYTASLNKALQGLQQNLAQLGPGARANLRKLPGSAKLPLGELDSALGSSMDDLQKGLKGLKVVYGFRGDYLVMALSDQALQAALAEGQPTLAQAPAFLAAFPSAISGHHWQYGADLPNFSPKDFSELSKSSKQSASEAKRFGTIFSDLFNRYDGMSSLSTVQGGVVINQGKLNWRW